MVIRIDLPSSRRLYIFITDGDVLLFAVEEDNLSNDLRPTDGREQFDRAEVDLHRTVIAERKEKTSYVLMELCRVLFTDFFVTF